MICGSSGRWLWMLNQITRSEQFQWTWLKTQHLRTSGLPDTIYSEVGSSHLLFSCAIRMHFSSYFLSGQFSGSAQLKDKSIAVCSQGIIMKSAVNRLAHRSLSVGNLMASCQLLHPLRHRQRASDGLLILINLHGGRCWNPYRKMCNLI